MGEKNERDDATEEVCQDEVWWAEQLAKIVRTVGDRSWVDEVETHEMAEDLAANEFVIHTYEERWPSIRVLCEPYVKPKEQQDPWGSDPIVRGTLKWIDRAMEIAHDVKKEFAYCKSSGTWAWFDRDEVENSDAWHGDHASFCDALFDAVHPYLDPDEDDDGE